MLNKDAALKKRHFYFYKAINAICKQRTQPLERFFDIAEILGVSVTEIINVEYKKKK
jgi:hypothetical protein